MGQQATLTARDFGATPVDHVLYGESVVREKDGSIKADWTALASGTPAYAQVRLTTSKKVLPSGVTRVSCRVSIPVQETVVGTNSSGYAAAPKVAYTDTVDVVGYFHPRSTAESRKRAKILALNVVNGHATPIAAIGTSGNVVELFDQLLQVA